MNILLTFHLLALGIWIGVVAAEFVIEFDGMKDDDSLIKASKLHYLTDIWIEIPALLTVLITGLLMIDEHHLEGPFLYKIVFSLLAIMFNLVCVYAVFLRRKYALISNITKMAASDLPMKLGGAGFIPSFVCAIGMGLYFVFQ
ncbi:MAG: hypothetical protein HRU20_17145 [Pseudomonadales bacterium]|nr:hypothetical protein [Pseudomonadales bacterium]